MPPSRWTTFYRLLPRYPGMRASAQQLLRPLHNRHLPSRGTFSSLWLVKKTFASPSQFLLLTKTTWQFVSDLFVVCSDVTKQGDCFGKPILKEGRDVNWSLFRMACDSTFPAKLARSDQHSFPLPQFAHTHTKINQAITPAPGRLASIAFPFQSVVVVVKSQEKVYNRALNVPWHAQTTTYQWATDEVKNPRSYGTTTSQAS